MSMSPWVYGVLSRGHLSRQVALALGQVRHGDVVKYVADCVFHRFPDFPAGRMTRKTRSPGG